MGKQCTFDRLSCGLCFVWPFRSSALGKQYFYFSLGNKEAIDKSTVCDMTWQVQRYTRVGKEKFTSDKRNEAGHDSTRASNIRTVANETSVFVSPR